MPEAAGSRAELFRGQPCVRLHDGAGGSALVALHGAQVLSWRDGTGPGDERFYLSDTAVFDGRHAIRGGMPVCFPQFADRGPLPKHGLVRNRAWTVTDEADTDADADDQAIAPAADGAQLTLRLADDHASRALWPHRFDARVQVVIAPGGLRVRLTIRNPGAQPWSFTAALHSYLRVAAPPEVRLHGLEGAPVWDKVRDAQGRESPAPLRFTEDTKEFDRVYGGSTGAKLLAEPHRSLRITQSPSFADTVVWNPAAALCATFTDMRADDWRRMLCVEAACVDAPVLLAAGARWTGWQALSSANADVVSATSTLSFASTPATVPEAR